MTTAVAAAPSRTLPHSLEAERAVLGAVLITEDAFFALSDLQPHHFFRGGHQHVWRAIVALISQDVTPDTLTVREALSREGKLEDSGGGAYIAGLTDGVPRTTNVEHYAAIVKRLWRLRECIHVGTRMAAEGYDGQDDPDAVLEDAQRDLLALHDASTHRGSVSAATAIAELSPTIERILERKGAILGLTSGYADLDAMTRGWRPGDLVLIAGRPSMGKAQPLNAAVLTSTGWTTMRELGLGDELASVDGRPSRVVGIFPQGRRQVHQVTFSDGRFTECCDEHLWRVSCRYWKEPRIIQTDKLRELLGRSRYRNRIWIEPFSGDFGHDDLLPVDPWLLGFLIGDGCLRGTSLMFSTADKDLVDRVRSVVGPGFEVVHSSSYSSYDYRIKQATRTVRRVRKGDSANGLIKAMKGLGLWGVGASGKFIPQCYKEANRDARHSLLQGLIDSDGWVERFGSVRLATTSERLASEVVDLVRSLGGAASYTGRQTSYRHLGKKLLGQPSFVCNLQHHDASSFASVGHKKLRLERGRRRQRRLNVVSVEPSRVTQTQCIAVSHRSNLYITDHYVVTHNTSLVGNIAERVAGRGEPVLFHSLEMSRDDVFLRMLAAHGQVDFHRFMSGYIADRDVRRISNAMAEVAQFPLYVDDTAAASLLHIRASARRVKMRHGLALLVIDYLQLMSGNPRAENRNQAVTELSAGLKALGKDLGVPVVALSQLSREASKRGDHRPVLSDLRESGALEQDADQVIFVHRPEMYPDHREEDRGVAELIVAKNRNGPTGIVNLVWLGEQMRFDSMAAARDEPRQERIWTDN